MVHVRSSRAAAALDLAMTLNTRDNLRVSKKGAGMLRAMDTLTICSTPVADRFGDRLADRGTNCLGHGKTVLRNEVV